MRSSSGSRLAASAVTARTAAGRTMVLRLRPFPCSVSRGRCSDPREEHLQEPPQYACRSRRTWASCIQRIRFFDTCASPLARYDPQCVRAAYTAERFVQKSSEPFPTRVGSHAILRLFSSVTQDFTGFVDQSLTKRAYELVLERGVEDAQPYGIDLLGRPLSHGRVCVRA